MVEGNPVLPSRFADLKREIAASYPDFEQRATKAWTEILEQLDQVTKTIVQEGPDVGPSFAYTSGHRIAHVVSVSPGP